MPVYTASIESSIEQKNHWTGNAVNFQEKDVPHRLWQLQTTQSDDNTGNYTSTLNSEEANPVSCSARNWTYITGRAGLATQNRRAELSRAWFTFDLSGWEEVGDALPQQWTMQSMTMSFTFKNSQVEDTNWLAIKETRLTSSYAINWSPRNGTNVAGMVDEDWDNYVTDAGFRINGDDAGNIHATYEYASVANPAGCDLPEQIFMNALSKTISRGSSSFSVCMRCPLESHRAPEMLGISQDGGMAYRLDTGSSGGTSVDLPPPIDSSSGYDIWGVGMMISESYSSNGWTTGLSPSGSHINDVSTSCNPTPAGNLGFNRTFGAVIFGSGSSWAVQPKLIIDYSFTEGGGGG